MSFFPMDPSGSENPLQRNEETLWDAFFRFLGENTVSLAMLVGIVSGLAVVVDAQLAVAAIAGTIVVGLSFRFPGFILSALLALMLFQRFQMIQFGFLGVPLSLAKISALLSIVVLIAHALVRRQELFLVDEVSSGLLLVVLAFLVTTLASDDPIASRRRMMSMVVLSTLTYFTYRFVRREHVNLLMSLLPGILGLLCAISFWDLFNGGVWSRATEIVNDSEVIRGSGSFGDPNVWASVNLFFIPLMLHHITVVKRPWLKAIDAAILIGLLINVGLSFSRAGYLVLAALGVLILWQQRQRPWMAAFMIVGGLGVLLAVVPLDVIEQRFNRLTIESDGPGSGSSLYLRYQVLIGGLQVFLDHPLLGVGPGQYGANVSYGGLADFGKTSHNIYVQILVELGLLGGVAFLVLFRGIFRAWRRLKALLPEESEDRRLLNAITLSFFAYGTMGLTLNILYHSYMWFMLGIGLSMVGWATAEHAQNETPTQAKLPANIHGKNGASFPYWMKNRVGKSG